MRIIVTGAAGFIGSHLCSKLLDLKHEVIGIDNFSDYYSSPIKMSNVSHLLVNDKFRLLKLDLANESISEYIKDTDYFFHLAAQPGVRASWGSTFERYVRDNIVATQRILEQLKSSEVKKFIFASSSSVYGDSESYPTTEDVLPRPVSPYGVTKLSAENICRVYEKNFGIPTVILRYFTVYGPRQRPDMAIYNFIRSMLKGEKITVFGNGEQERDFTYVEDVVRATISCIDSDLSGETINVGSGYPVKLNYLIKLISDATQREPIVEYVERQKGDVAKTYADITKARKLLSYKPKFGIGEGLEQQVKWQESIIGK